MIGTTIDLNGMPYEIVGVAPAKFRGPMVAIDTPLYVPLMMQREIQPGRDLIESRGNNMMNAVARLRDGQTIERAQSVMDAMLLQLTEEYPDHYAGQAGTTLVLQNEAGIHPVFRSAQVGMSTVMMVVVALLLLIDGGHKSQARALFRPPWLHLPIGMICTPTPAIRSHLSPLSLHFLVAIGVERTPYLDAPATPTLVWRYPHRRCHGR